MGPHGQQTFQEWISLCFMYKFVSYPMRSLKIIHSVRGKSELRTVMTVRMRPIYYNSSLFDLILIFNKSGIYFTDQL